jgi:hypothetical protein
MLTVKEIGCFMSGVHWTTSNVNPNHRIVCRTGTVVGGLLAREVDETRRTIPDQFDEGIGETFVSLSF